MRFSSLKKAPSPALAVSMLALTVALSGTATGLPGKRSIDGNDLKPRVVKPFNIKRNAVRPFQLAPNAVRPWHIANGAVRQNDLHAGTIAARAHALITSAGNVSASAPSHGLSNANVDRQSTGDYCVSGLPFKPRVAIAQVEESVSNDEGAYASVTPSDDSECPGAENIHIATNDVEDGGNTNGPVEQNASFFLVIF